MPDDFSISVNPDGPISVYMQIENQVRFAIASGRVKPGQILPSVRDLADDLKVNANTITKAYRDLELMGLVTARRGIGVIVANDGRASCRKEVEEMVRGHLRDAVAECLASGMARERITKIVSDVLKEKPKPYTR